MSGRPVYIYGLIDPDSQEVRYVGKSFTPRPRLIQHISTARRGGKDRRSCWIRSVLARGQRPAMRILEAKDEDTWEEAERRQIALFRAQSGSLTNTTPGGDVGARTLTIAEVDALASLYESGLSMKEVGKRFGVTAATVCHILHSGSYDNVSIRPKAQIRRRDEKQVMEIRLLYAQGVGLTPIAERFDLTIPMVSGIVRGDVRRDLPMVADDPGAARKRRSAGENHAGAKLSDWQVADIVSAAVSGESQRAIARRYGVAFGTICKIVHGESRRDVAYEGATLAKRKLHRLTKSEALHALELRASGMTFEGIARIFGVHEGSIRSIAKGINHRDVGTSELREAAARVDRRRT